MNKKLAFVLVLILSMALLASCGGSGDTSVGGSEGDTFDPANVKTLGDVIYLENEQFAQWAYTDDSFVYAFDHDGIAYRAIADLPEDVENAISELEYDDPDRDAKINELIAPLEIRTFENLTDGMPTQEELDELIGKTGGELFEDDWTYWFYDVEGVKAGLYHDVYSFMVEFDYDGEPMENTDDFDFYEEFKDLTIKSITCDGIGDATNIEE